VYGESGAASGGSSNCGQRTPPSWRVRFHSVLKAPWSWRETIFRAALEFVKISKTGGTDTGQTAYPDGGACSQPDIYSLIEGAAPRSLGRPVHGGPLFDQRTSREKRRPLAALISAIH